MNKAIREVVVQLSQLTVCIVRRHRSVAGLSATPAGHGDCIFLIATTQGIVLACKGVEIVRLPASGPGKSWALGARSLKAHRVWIYSIGCDYYIRAFSDINALY